MISTFSSSRAWAIASSIALLACGGRDVLAQSSALSPGFLEHPAVTPPLQYQLYFATMQSCFWAFSWVQRSFACVFDSGSLLGPNPGGKIFPCIH